MKSLAWDVIDKLSKKKKVPIHLRFWVWANKLIGRTRCQGFEGPCYKMNATRYHMNTMYQDKEANYAVHCPECRMASEDLWGERWKEHWAEVL